MQKMNNHGSAVSFIVAMLVIGVVVAGLVGTFAYQMHTASTDTAIAGGNLSNSVAGDGVGNTADDVTGGGVPGGPAMLMLLALLFIVIPVIIFARNSR